jgi:hypothetical protein
MKPHALQPVALSPQQEDGWVELGWSLLQQSMEDLATFCRWGLITPAGKCMPWPKCVRFNKDGSLQRQFVGVAHMRGPNDHRQLRRFFLDEKQGQYWADLVGWKKPMAECWQQTLKHNCGRNP